MRKTLASMPLGIARKSWLLYPSGLRKRVRVFDVEIVYHRKIKSHQKGALWPLRFVCWL
jgi:hypothetical protein